MDAAQQHVLARLSHGERPEAIFHDLVHSGWNPQMATALIASVQSAPAAVPQPAAPAHSAPLAPQQHETATTPTKMTIASTLLWINLALSAVVAVWPFLTLDGPRDVLTRFFPPVIPYLIAAVLLWIFGLVYFIVSHNAAKSRGEILPKRKKVAALLIATPVVTTFVLLGGLFAYMTLGVMCGGAASLPDCGIF